MIIKYNGFIVFELHVANNDPDEIIDILHLELLAYHNICKENYPNAQKGYVVYLNEEETIKLFNKKIALRSERFIIDNETDEKISYILVTHYFVYNRRSFYDGDLWIAK